LLRASIRNCVKYVHSAPYEHDKRRNNLWLAHFIDEEGGGRRHMMDMIVICSPMPSKLIHCNIANGVLFIGELVSLLWGLYFNA
jgi:hypothetical protein